MYPFVTHTWNIIKGKCPHDCSYCYCKKWGEQVPLHFDEKELKTDMGSGNLIFVGSSCDAWSDAIPVEWIELMLEHCRLYPQNTYLFQSKNPKRIVDWLCDLPPRTIIGTTIESNRCCCSFTPGTICTSSRYLVMRDILTTQMVSIEPIMDFDLEVLVGWIREIKPEFVSIGADSKGHKLPEPTPDKVESLIEELGQITKVIIKDNLKRLRRVKCSGKEVK